MNKVLEYIIRAKDLTAKGINSAAARVRSLSSSVGSSAKSIGANMTNIKSAIDLAVAATMKLVNVFASAIKEAFKFEKALTDFKVLLGGSIEDAKTHIEDLRKFAASTPLTFGDLSQASKLLLSFGADVEKVMPSLKMLGDISLGDAQKFQGLALVFAQVQSAGKLMGQDLLQMINQGFNPLTIISQQTGKSMSELKDLMSEGAISFEMVAEAMRIATSEGGLFHNAMEEASKTGEGMVSTLQDNWTEAVRTFGEAFSGAAKDGVGYLTEKLQELTEDGSVQRWAEEIASAMATVAGAIKPLGDLFSWFKEKWQRTIGVAGKFASAADKVWNEGGSFSEQIAAGKSAALDYWNELDYKHSADYAAENIRKNRAKKQKAKQKAASLGASTQSASLSDMFTEAEAKALEAKEAEAAEAAEKAAEKAAEEYKREMERAIEEEERMRVQIERQIAAERRKEWNDYISEAQKNLQGLQDEQAKAESALAAAQDKVRQAWGWYRDKDSLKAQIEEEKAEAAAQKQFEKDFEKLKFRRDWRTADNLSLDEEAVRRVGIALEEEKAAIQYAKETAENTKELATTLEQLLEMKEN